jgi:TRAP-type mannitol/chloroaromatic compound transport system permease small subunit
MAERIIKAIHSLNENLGRITAWLTTLLVGLVCFNVFYRYLLNENLNWLKELEWHVFALIFLFGAAYTLKHDAHVRVDVFYDRFSVKDKALVNFWGSLLFLLPWTALLIYASWQYAVQSFLIREGSPEPGGLSAWYPIKFAVPAGMFFLFLQGLALLLESWQTLRQRSESSPNTGME